MNVAPAKVIIEEAALELGINAAFVEKDWYVVQLIREIISADRLGAQLIFSGGAALAYGDFSVCLCSSLPTFRSRRGKCSCI